MCCVEFPRARRCAMSVEIGPRDSVRLSNGLVGIYAYGRDVRVVLQDQVLNFTITFIGPLDGRLLLQSSLRSDMKTQYQRPGEFTSGCHFLGHATHGDGWALYFAVATTAGQILIMSDQREVVDLVDVYAPQSEVSFICGLASTPTSFHVENPHCLHETDGRVVSLDGSRTKLAVWDFRSPGTTGCAKPLHSHSLEEPVTEAILLPCSDWVVLKTQQRIIALRLKDGVTQVVHEKKPHEQFGPMQYCFETVIAFATSSPSDVMLHVKGIDGKCVTSIVHAGVRCDALLVIGLPPSQHLLLAVSGSIAIYGLGAAASLPLFTVCPARANLTGTVDNDELFPLYGSGLPAPGVEFAPIDVRFAGDPEPSGAAIVKTTDGEPFQLMDLPVLLSEWSGQVMMAAFSHPLRWLLFVDSSAMLHAWGPNPSPLPAQWNRAPPSILRPVLELALKRLYQEDGADVSSHSRRKHQPICGL